MCRREVVLRDDEMTSETTRDLSCGAGCSPRPAAPHQPWHSAGGRRCGGRHRRRDGNSSGQAGRTTAAPMSSCTSTSGTSTGESSTASTRSGWRRGGSRRSRSLGWGRCGGRGSTCVSTRRPAERVVARSRRPVHAGPVEQRRPRSPKTSTQTRRSRTHFSTSSPRTDCSPTLEGPRHDDLNPRAPLDLPSLVC